MMPTAITAQLALDFSPAADEVLACEEISLRHPSGRPHVQVFIYTMPSGFDWSISGFFASCGFGGAGGVSTWPVRRPAVYLASRLDATRDAFSALMQRLARPGDYFTASEEAMVRSWAEKLTLTGEIARVA